MRLEDEIKQVKGFKSEKDKAMLNIVYTANVMMERMLEALKPFNINDQHYNILRILRGKHPESACPGDIKDILINKRGDLTRLIDKLVKEGYVVRQINPENRRMVMNTITDKGLQLIEDIGTFDHMQDMRQNISEEDAKTLNDIIDKLRD